MTENTSTTNATPATAHAQTIAAAAQSNAQRDAEYVGRQSVQSFRDQFRDSGRPEFYSRWAHWFLHERLKDPVPPFDPHAIGQTARH